MRLFRDVRSVSASVVVGLLLSSVRSVLLLRILSPALLGAWKSALLVDTAGEFARLGVNRGIELRVPFLAARGETEESAALESTAAVFSLVLGLVFGVVVFVAGCMAQDQHLRIALWAIAPIMAVSQPYYFLRDLASARRRFELRTRETIGRSAADVPLSIAAGLKFQLAGLGAASTLVVLCAGWYLQRRLRFRFRMHFEMSRLRALIGVGFPFSLTEAAFELLRRLDVIAIAFCLGPQAVGYYGISLIILDAASVVGRKGVSQVVSPHLIGEMGRTGSTSSAARFYEAPARLFCYVLPPLLAVGSFAIDGLVGLALPQYLPGVAAAKISMWAVFFFALHASLSSFLVAAGMITAALRFYAVLIPVVAAAQVVVLRTGHGIEGAAWTTVAAMAVLSAGELYLARSSCGYSRRVIARYMGSLYLPLGLALLLVLVIQTGSARLLLSGGLRPLVELGFFLVAYAPVLFVYESRFSLLRAVRNAT